ncbi:MAG TPA: hypothetical protein VEJ84_14240, partial [Acidimicrobiales bacterium]|nr:hypothetical protein [Acidimicrobiales bacterium]
FSHAVHKGALLDPDVGVAEALWEREVITPVVPSDDYLEVANAVMTVVTDLVGEMCYARVDVVDGNNGAPVVLEVELIEPSLFLPAAEGSGRRFAEVLARRLRS